MLHCIAVLNEKPFQCINASSHYYASHSTGNSCGYILHCNATMVSSNGSLWGLLPLCTVAWEKGVQHITGSCCREAGNNGGKMGVASSALCWYAAVEWLGMSKELLAYAMTSAVSVGHSIAMHLHITKGISFFLQQAWRTSCLIRPTMLLWPRPTSDNIYSNIRCGAGKDTTRPKGVCRHLWLTGIAKLLKANVV